MLTHTFDDYECYLNLVVEFEREDGEEATGLNPDVGICDIYLVNGDKRLSIMNYIPESHIKDMEEQLFDMYIRRCERD